MSSSHRFGFGVQIWEPYTVLTGFFKTVGGEGFVLTKQEVTGVNQYMNFIVLFRLIIFHPTYFALTLYNLEQVLLSDFYTLYFMLCTLYFMLYTGHFISSYNSYSNTFILMASCCSVLYSTEMQYTVRVE